MGKIGHEHGHQHAMLVTKHLRPARGGALRRDDARNLLRRTIEFYVADGRLTVLAWAFLPSKASLMIALPTPQPLPETLGDLFGYYTRRFNVRYGKEGPLFRTKFLKKVFAGPEEIAEGIEKMHRAVDALGLVRRKGGEAWSSADVYRTGAVDSITTRFRPPLIRVMPALAERQTG